MKKIFLLSMIFLLSISTLSSADQLSVKKIEVIAKVGKSVDWSPTLNRIASAQLGRDSYYDVFTMKPDGSDIRVLTQDLKGCPQKHNGNPCFHPSGRFLVFTGENEQLPDTDKEVRRRAVPGSGLGSNLFIVGVNGRVCQQLLKYPLSQPIRAIIHPQFSKNGRSLAWAERVRDGDNFGGGWELKIADFLGGNSPHLKNIKTLTPGEHDCFYEAHNISSDSKKLLFSGNLKRGQPHTGLDIYEMDLATGNLTQLTHSYDDWDEHAHYSPDGRKIAWMSSRGFDIDYGPEKGHGTSWADYLITELWIMDSDGSNPKQLTHFNTPGYPEYMRGIRCIVSDSSWSPDGKSICASVALFKGEERAVRLVRIWLE